MTDQTIEYRSEFTVETRPGSSDPWRRSGSAHRYVGPDAPVPDHLARYVESANENLPGEYRVVRREVRVIADPWEEATT